MITNKEKINKVFSIFHDGTICEFKNLPDRLRLKIDCYYLSQMIDTNFESFFVDIFNPVQFKFLPWSEKGISRKVITDLSYISKNEFNIFSSNIVESQFCIDVEVEDSKTSHIGGSLYFNCDGIKVYNQILDEITFKLLSKLSEDYWSKFKTK